jgi:hypothetical protein
VSECERERERWPGVGDTETCVPDTDLLAQTDVEREK